MVGGHGEGRFLVTGDVSGDVGQEALEGLEVSFDAGFDFGKSFGAGFVLLQLSVGEVATEDADVVPLEAGFVGHVEGVGHELHAVGFAGATGFPIPHFTFTGVIDSSEVRQSPDGAAINLEL